MRWQRTQLELEVEAHHRALRRCHGCGAYARTAEQAGGALLCERCAQKAHREKAPDRQEDPTKVDFLI